MKMQTGRKTSRLIQVNYNTVHGRFLTALKDISPGTLLLSEEAFSTILLEQNSSFCSFCYKPADIVTQCDACKRSQYCSTQCKLSAWKRYHWFECFVGSYLEKMELETALALRTLLNASFSLHLEPDEVSKNHILTEVANDMNNAATSLLSNKSLNSNYLGIYSLQTHIGETEVDKTCRLLHLGIRVLAKLLVRCLDLHQKLLAEEMDKESEKNPSQENASTETLLNSVLERLNLHSYAQLECFDVNLWKIFLKKHFKEIEISEKTVDNITLSERPSSVADLLERLLMRHALQMRTNGQAIFKLLSTTENAAISNIEQQRIATGYFPTLSMMNHSCLSNTTLAFDGRQVQVIASRKIRKGKEICHCYGPHFCKHPFSERQMLLKKQYFFTCRCKICAEDLEDSDKAMFRMQFHAFKCTKCGDPIKLDMTKEENASGKCINEGCRKQQNCADAKKILAKAKRDCNDAHELLENDKVEKALTKFKTILDVMENILYRNHTDIAYVNDKIAQCYIILSDNSAAIPHLTKSITINGMLYGSESIEIAHEYQKLASLYFNIRSFRLAARYSEKVLSAYAMHYGDKEMFPPGADDMKKISELCQRFTR